MLADTAKRVRLCVLDDLPEGLGRGFVVAGRKLAVFRTRAGKVFAVDGVCPHRGAPLADGMLAGEQVVCPFHAFRFDARTGECDQPGECGVRTYPVEVRDGAVLVSI